MCCLFGIHDYGHKLTRKQKNRILSVLSVACEERGTDATGIAYNADGNLRIYKRPWPAHWMRFSVPDSANVISGHTRMTTQGNQCRNFNNHPFLGKTGNTAFALAHNGVLRNDISLRKNLKLPATRVETDSYIAVQLIESAKDLSFASLSYMAEKLEGSFTFTVLSEKDELYFVKGDNPMCIYHYPERGLYLYASTEEILNKALRKLPFSLGTPIRVHIFSGDILCIDAHGNQSRGSFDDSKLHIGFGSCYRNWFDYPPVSRESSYLEDLKSVAAYCGLFPEDIDALLADGFTTDEIEEMLYCG